MKEVHYLRLWEYSDGMGRHALETACGTPIKNTDFFSTDPSATTCKECKESKIWKRKDLT